MPKKTTRSTEIGDHLKRPYHHVLVPDAGGMYSAEIEEFPGCLAVGESAAEALANLMEVAEIWLESALEHGRAIPDPLEESDFSGRFVLRLPKSLHAKAAKAAQRDGASLNTFIATCVAESVGERTNSAPTYNVFLSSVWQPLPSSAMGVFEGTPLSIPGASRSISWAGIP